jgi:hypothetical protein
VVCKTALPPHQTRLGAKLMSSAPSGPEQKKGIKK